MTSLKDMNWLRLQSKSCKLAEFCAKPMVDIKGHTQYSALTEINPVEVNQVNIEQKARLIRTIISHLRFEAKRQNKAFNEGDTFFALCFKDDKELLQIAKLAC